LHDQAPQPLSAEFLVVDDQDFEVQFTSSFRVTGAAWNGITIRASTPPSGRFRNRRDCREPYKVSSLPLVMERPMPEQPLDFFSAGKPTPLSITRSTSVSSIRSAVIVIFPP